ncbi:MAG: porin [Acidobacteria bacterium]|nr:MAG: porin [Acidobacteriota bacterium]
MKRFSLTLVLLILWIGVPLFADDTPQVVISAGKGGFLLTSPDGDFLLRIRGYVQADGRFFFGDETPSISTFALRRVRPVFEGTVYKYFDFKVMPDFGEGKVVLQDAYLDARFRPFLKVRFGKGKVPFGLERLQSATDLTLIERSLATNLVPNRDLGIYLFGDVANQKVSYAAGVFNGIPDGANFDTDQGKGKEFAGRIFVLPVNGLGLGIAVTDGNSVGNLLTTDLPSYKTAGQQTFFKYSTGVFSDGQRLRYTPQAYYYWKSFGFLTEYVNSQQEVRKDTTTGTFKAKIKNDAYNATVMYVVTGENATYKDVTPKNNFDMDSGHFGAIEVAGRYSVLDIDNDAFPIFADPLASATKAKNWAVGANWYLNRNVKWMVSYDNIDFDGGSLPTEKIVQVRFQIAW